MLEKTEDVKSGMVGTTGFEPATSRTPSVRATRLRYVPTAAARVEPQFDNNERITDVREASRKGGAGRANRAAFCGSKAPRRFHFAAPKKWPRNRRSHFRAGGGVRLRSASARPRARTVL